MSQTPNLADVVHAALEEQTTKMWSSTVGRIVRFDPGKRCADIQPVIKHAYESETGDRVVESLPVIPNVPIIFPGSRKYEVVIPLEPNDTVLLVILSQSIKRWKEKGVVGGEIDPREDRRHHLGDAVAIPGLFDLTYVPAATRQFNTYMSIGGIGNSAPSIRIDVAEEGGGIVRIGSPANCTGDGSRVVVQSALDDFMNALAVAKVAVNTPVTVPGTAAALALTALETQLKIASFGQPWSSRTIFTKAS